MRLIFDQPMQTTPRAPDSAPRRLSDARLVRGGVVVAEREAQASDAVSGIPLGRIGSTLVTTEPSGSTAYDAFERTGPDGTAVYSALLGLVKTLRRIGVDGIAHDIPFGGYADFNYTVTTDDRGYGVAGNTMYVGYLIIPLNDRDEAGAPVALSVAKRALASAPTGATERVTIEATMYGEESFVEVYKTYLIDYEGGLDKLAWATLDISLDTSQLFHLGRYPVTDDGTNYVCTIVDNTDYYTAEAVVATFTDPGHVKDGSTMLNEIVVPTVPYDRPINVWPSGSSSLHKFSAQRLHYSGGRLFAGNVTWEAKLPQALVAHNDSTAAGTARTIRVRREYTLNGKIYLSDPTDFTTVKALKILWEGEQAVRLYIDGGSGYQLYERITPSATGAYTTAYAVTNKVPKNLTWDAEAYDASRLADEQDGEVETTFAEPLATFISAVNRPREITFEQFVLPRGTEVRMLAPSRLAEEESLRAHDFYAASDTALFAVRDTGDGYIPDLVSDDFGCALSSETGQPVFAACETGLAMLGTDGRIYFLRGRQFEPLDATVPGEWSAVYGLAYDPLGTGIPTAYGPADTEPLLWAWTDTGLWAFSFWRRGWVGHRALTGDERFLFYDEALLLGRAGTSVDVIDQSGPPRDGAVITQRLMDDAEVEMRRVAVDFNAGVYDQDEMVTLRCAVRHPGIAQVTDDPEPLQVDRRFEAGCHRPRNPRLVGRGAQIAVSGFDTMRSLDIDLKPLDD